MRIFNLGYSEAEKGESGEAVGTKYDTSYGCIKCGTNTKYIGNTAVTGFGKIKKNFCVTLDSDKIISEQVYHSLTEDFDVATNGFVQVMNKKGILLPFYHLRPEGTLPKMEEGSTLAPQQKQCDHCQRNWFAYSSRWNSSKKMFEPPIRYVYKYDQTLWEATDMLKSWEHFGGSNLVEHGDYVIRFARPLIFVSEKFKNAFEALGIKKATFIEAELL